MSSRTKKQNSDDAAEIDEQPVSKRLRRHRSNVPTFAPTNVPTPSTSSKPQAPEKTTKSSASPSSALLGSNDKCLRALFQHLNVEALCQMANVNKRFRKIAEEVFVENHKEFELHDRLCNMSAVRRVLCKFGHLMTSFDASDAYFRDPRGLDVTAIAKYCTNNLDALYLRNATIDCNAVRPLFKRLKKLELILCKLTGTPTTLFANMPNLEFFAHDGSETCRFLSRTYPKLEELAFDVNYPAYVTFFELLAYNPQLRRLTIWGLPEDVYISAVVKSLKQLECLRIVPHMMSSTPEIQTKAVFLQLSKLKNLTKLSMDAGCEIYAKFVGPLMDAFAKQNIQLNHLQLNEFEIGSKDIKSILKIQTIKYLCLNEIDQINEADLITLATKLPSLSTLQLDLGSNVKTPITPNGLTKIVKERKKLICMWLVRVQNLKIDQKIFENLLKVARNDRRPNEEKQLFVGIVGQQRTTSFNVPDAVQKSGNAYLKIKYSTSDANEDDEDDEEEEEEE